MEGQLDSQVKMAASTTSNTQSHAQQIPKTPERARLHSPAVAAQKRDYEEGEYTIYYLFYLTIT